MYNLGLKKQKEQNVAVDFYQKKYDYQETDPLLPAEGQHTFEFYLQKYRNEC